VSGKRISTLAPLSANALRVLEARYLRRDTTGKVSETPEQLFQRVAGAVADAERALGNRDQASYWEEQFLGLLESLDFLPNSPTLMNAGTPLGQLSACFVLPVEDSMESIFEALKRMALIQRTGGGTGFSFSRLRPRNDVIASTGGQASGPVAFMRVFDSATENIKQGGRRRGANMGVLRVDHPDVLEFVNAKRDESSLRNFNLSVGVTDEFFEAVRDGRRYPLVHPGTGKKVREVPAREVFDAIVAASWESGDPGVIFLDAVNRANPTPRLGPIEATNPCGEIPLLPNESCNLGSLNLSNFVRERDGGKEIDRERLRLRVRQAVRFLDNVVEVSKYPAPEIARLSRANRKIGLGVMGFAELAFRLGISYDSDRAAELGGEIMSLIAQEATRASEALAAERGVFPNWPGSVYSSRGLRVRNATRTAIAPTGTISIIAGTTASIEPLFALAYRRTQVLEGETFYEVNALFREALERRGLEVEAIVGELWERGSLQKVKSVPAELRRLFVTALEIPSARHLQIQAAFQKGVDNSVSKTINLPQEATPADVAQALRSAWELGLKGLTLYRYGSKSRQVLELGKDERAHHYEQAARCDPEECKV
jgi:ribonucleoside-diphosphate reductase alpha chain